MLIRCPECGKEISDKVEACPNCGAPQPALERTSMLAQQSVTRRRVVTIVAAVLVLLLLAGGSAFALLYRWPVIYEIGDVRGTSGITQEEFAEYVRQAASAWNEAAGRIVLSDHGLGRPVRVSLHVDQTTEAYVAAHDAMIRLNGLHKIHVERLLQGLPQEGLPPSGSGPHIGGGSFDLLKALQDDGSPHTSADPPGVTPTEEEITAARRTEADLLEACWPEATEAVRRFELQNPFSSACGLWRDALVAPTAPGERAITIRVSSYQYLESTLLHHFGHALSLPWAKRSETDVMYEQGTSTEISPRDASELKRPWRQ